jgi:hypothetical protein
MPAPRCGGFCFPAVVAVSVAGGVASVSVVGGDDASASVVGGDNDASASVAKQLRSQTPLRNAIRQKSAQDVH